MLRVSHDVNSSTPLKQGELARQELFPVGTPPVDSPVKRVADVHLMWRVYPRIW